MRTIASVILSSGLVILAAMPAFAECSLVPNGTTILTPETRPVGTIIYNSDYDVLQECRDDGSWWALGMLGADLAGGPAGCGNVGDECSDGTYYIGQINGNDIYATATIHNRDETWNNGSFDPPWTVTGFNSLTDGQGNTAGLVALSDAGAPYLAAEYCDGLSAHGHDDWYLPAFGELNLFWNDGSPIAGVSESGSWYWSSTEDDGRYALDLRFNDGDQDQGTKSSISRVRCVRR